MAVLMRPQYFYNILIITLLSGLLYFVANLFLLSDDNSKTFILSQPIPYAYTKSSSGNKTSEGGGGGIRNRMNINSDLGLGLNLDSSGTGATSGGGGDDDQKNKKDWYKIFLNTAHNFYNKMFTSNYLKEFRKWAIFKEREFLEVEMRGYQLNQNNISSLKSLIMEEGGEPIRNVIFTTWRSGSTFLGEVLDNHPGTYYHYEPLLHFGIVQVRHGPLAQEGVRVLKDLLNCNYSNLSDYIKFGEDHHWLYNHNSRVWQYCELNFEVCWDPEFLTGMCKMFPFQSIKTVRMRLNLARELLNDKKLNIRLVLLIRDPRGTMQSRMHRDWCIEETPDCFDPQLLCSDMEQDYYEAEKLRQEFPGRFLPVRYEDLSANPYSGVKKIFKLFRLQYHPRVESFLNEHTVIDIGGVSSTFRDSKTAPFHWKKDFQSNFSQVVSIQNKCRKAMALWGYGEASSETEMLNFNPLLPPPWKEMKIDTDPPIQRDLSKFNISNYNYTSTINNAI